MMLRKKKSRSALKRCTLQREILEGRYVLATFMVTSDMDAGPGTLRDAIEQSNLLPGIDDIVFAPILDGGQILLSSGELQITDSLNIIGPSNGLTLDAQQTSSVIHAAFETDVALSDLTITGGYVSSYYDQSAAGLTTDRGDLTIRRVTISGNTSLGGATGGGVLCGFGDDGSISMYDSIISDNEADFGGVRCGTINVHDSAISGNEGGNRGGVGGLRGYDVAIYDSVISGNIGKGSFLSKFQTSAAIYTRTLLMENSVVADNVSDLDMTGYIPQYAEEQSVTAKAGSISASTFTNNIGGPALRATGTLGPITISNSEFRSNSTGIVSSGGLTVTDSIVTGNGAGIRAEGYYGSPTATVPVYVRNTSISNNGVGVWADSRTTYSPQGQIRLYDSNVSDNSTGIFAGTRSTVNFKDGEIDSNQTGAVSSGSPEFGRGLSKSHGSIVTENSTGIKVNDRGGISISESTVSDHTGQAIQTAGGLSIWDSRIIDNSTNGDGGAIHVTGDGSFSISRSLISGNSAVGNGGAIAITDPCACPEESRYNNIFNSTIAGNSSGGNGGGVFEADNLRRKMWISNSTLSGNTAKANGGGLYLTTPHHGLFSPPLIVSSTITSNSAGGDGGGIGVASNATRQRPTINSIVSGNNDTDGSAPDVWDPLGTMDFRYSLVGNNSGGLLGEASPDLDGNLVGGPVNGVIDAKLGPLVLHGGMTPTHGLHATSPALNSGDLRFPDGYDYGYLPISEFDQRGEGYARVLDKRIDMGAVEGVELVGDFDDDLQFACSDVDSLVSEIASSSDDLMFDINADGFVNGDDLDTWLSIAGLANLPSQEAFQLGDANLDGTVDGQDFTIWSNHKFTNSAAWCDGDFDADGIVGGRDFLLWNANKTISANDVGSRDLREIPIAPHAAIDANPNRVISTRDPLTETIKSDGRQFTEPNRRASTDALAKRVADAGSSAANETASGALPLAGHLSQRSFAATRFIGANYGRHFHAAVDSVWAESQASEEDADDTEFLLSFCG